MSTKSLRLSDRRVVNFQSVNLAFRTEASLQHNVRDNIHTCANSWLEEHAMGENGIFHYYRVQTFGHLLQGG